MAQESAEQPRGLVERIRQAINGDDEPRDVNELKTVLREAADRDIVSDDTMTCLLYTSPSPRDS